MQEAPEEVLRVTLAEASWEARLRHIRKDSRGATDNGGGRE